MSSPLRVFVAPTDRRVAPFDEPPSDLLIANRPLSAWRDEAIAKAGLVRIDAIAPPCLVIPDALFTDGHTLARFAAGAQGRNAAMVLARSLFATATTPVQPHLTETEAGFRFDEVRYLSGGDEPAEDVIVDPDEYVHTLKLPEVFGGPVQVGLPKHPVITVHHWVHLLWANQAAAAMIARSAPGYVAVLRVIWAIVRARSLNPWRVMARLNTIGKGCDIHPTAIVEASTLGNGVTVGPYARVVFSQLADGVTVMSGAEVEASTIGEGATVGQRCGLRLCVIYPGAMASQIQMQACVLGRRTVTVPGSYSIDLNFDRDIRVMFDGKLVSTGSRFLGSAFGHDCRIGTGIWLASGRSVPNGSVWVRHPEGLVSRVPEEAGAGPLVNDGGTMRPIGGRNGGGTAERIGEGIGGETGETTEKTTEEPGEGTGEEIGKTDEEPGKP